MTIEDDIKDAFNQYDRPQDYLHEIAEGLIPIYYYDLILDFNDKVGSYNDVINGLTLDQYLKNELYEYYCNMVYSLWESREEEE